MPFDGTAFLIVDTVVIRPFSHHRTCGHGKDKEPCGGGSHKGSATLLSGGLLGDGGVLRFLGLRLGLGGGLGDLGGFLGLGFLNRKLLGLLGTYFNALLGQAGTSSHRRRW